MGNVTSFVPDIGAMELQTAVVTNISDATAPNAPFASLRRTPRQRQRWRIV